MHRLLFWNYGIRTHRTWIKTFQYANASPTRNIHHNDTDMTNHLNCLLPYLRSELCYKVCFPAKATDYSKPWKHDTKLVSNMKPNIELVTAVHMHFRCCKRKVQYENLSFTIALLEFCHGDSWITDCVSEIISPFHSVQFSEFKHQIH